MASRNGVMLPALQPRVNYSGFPRRYEETKPALVQEFSHKRILFLGHSIQRRSLEQFEEIKSDAIQQAEREVWEQAEELKQQTVETAIAKLQAEHEKIIKKLTKAHEKASKEEAMRVEAEMQMQAIEQAQQEREAAEVRLKSAVNEAVHQGEIALEEAVVLARREELKKATDEKEALQRAADEKYALALEAADREKCLALRKLLAEKEQERENAVKEAHEVEQKIALQKLEAQKSLFEQNIRILHTHIQEYKMQIQKKEAECNEILSEKKTVERELAETRDEFDKFIQRVKPFNDTESAFLMPPKRSSTFA